MVFTGRGGRLLAQVSQLGLLLETVEELFNFDL
jgi:hypothetical protein